MRLSEFADATIELAEAEITHLDECNACQKRMRTALRLTHAKVASPAGTRVQNHELRRHIDIEVFSITHNLLQERRERLDRFRHLHRQALKTEAVIRSLYRDRSRSYRD